MRMSLFLCKCFCVFDSANMCFGLILFKALVKCFIILHDITLRHIITVGSSSFSSSLPPPPPILC